MKPSWHRNWIENRSVLENAEKRTSIIKSLFFYWSLSFRGSKLGAKIEQNRSENEVQDKVHVGIDFWSIWDGFWCQVGMENPPKIHSKRCPKKGAKKERLGWASEPEKIASWGVLGTSWGVRPPGNQCGRGAARVRRGCDAGADGVLVPPGAAIIKDYQLTNTSTG